VGSTRNAYDIGGFDTDGRFWGFFPDRIVPGDEIRLQQILFSAGEWVEQFVEDLRLYIDVSEDPVRNFTLAFAEKQLDGLREVATSADDSLPLHLASRLFQDDKTGTRVKRLLEAFSAQLDRYHGLASITQQGLRSESAANPSRLESLRQLDRIAAQLGAVLGTPGEIIELTGALQRECDRLDSALHVIRDFCWEKGIPFDGGRMTLSRLTALARVVAEAPEELLHLQNVGVTRAGSEQAIEVLAHLQRAWMDLSARLDGLLYLDTLPGEGALKQAILTIREGDAWYRRLQSRWRSAIATHRSLQRTKQRLRTKDRLTQLEAVAELLQLKGRWKSDPAWMQYLGFSAPADPVALDGYLTLARWNRSAILVLEDLQAPVFSPSELTPERARSLRREFAGLAAALSTATSALEALDALLPKLANIPGSQAIAKYVEVVGSFAQLVSTQITWLEAEAPHTVRFALCLQASEASVERRNLATLAQDNHHLKFVLSDHFAGMATDIPAALAVLTFVQGFEEYPFTRQVKTKLKSGHPVETANVLGSALEQVVLGLQNVSKLQQQLAGFGEFDLATWVGG
jgi:hypothetical protein